MLPFNEATFGRKWDYDEGIYEDFALIPDPMAVKTWIMAYKDGGFDLIATGEEEDFDLNGFSSWSSVNNDDLMAEITDLYYCKNFDGMNVHNRIWHRDITRDVTENITADGLSPIKSIETPECTASPQKVKVKVHKRTAAKVRRKELKNFYK